MVIEIRTNDSGILTENVDCSTTRINCSVVVKCGIYDISMITIHKNRTCITSRGSLVFKKRACRIGLTFSFCNIVPKGTIINSNIITFSIIAQESVMMIFNSTNHNSGTFSTSVIGEITVSYNYIVMTYSKCTTIFSCSCTINKITVFNHLRFFNGSKSFGVIPMYINCKPSGSNIDKITINYLTCNACSSFPFV